MTFSAEKIQPRIRPRILSNRDMKQLFLQIPARQSFLQAPALFSSLIGREITRSPFSTSYDSDLRLLEEQFGWQFSIVESQMLTRQCEKTVAPSCPTNSNEAKLNRAWWDSPFSKTIIFSKSLMEDSKAVNWGHLMNHKLRITDGLGHLFVMIG